MVDEKALQQAFGETRSRDFNRAGGSMGGFGPETGGVSTGGTGGGVGGFGSTASGAGGTAGDASPEAGGGGGAGSTGGAGAAGESPGDAGGAGAGGGGSGGSAGAAGEGPGSDAAGGPDSLRLGGLISGPGGPRSDSIPALLSDGEFVVNAAATKNSLALLTAINAGAIPKMADGGPVARVPSFTMPPARSADSGSGGGRGPNGPTFIIDARGADRAGLARVEAMIQRIDGQLEFRAVGAMLDSRRRGGSVATAFRER